MVDASTSEPRQGASVAIVGTTRGAIADANGRFVIPGVPAGDIVLRARLLGYKTVERPATVVCAATRRASNSDWRRKPRCSARCAREARPVERDAFESRPSVGTVRVTSRAAQGVPKFGEPDIIRVVQLLPGVEARNDFSTGLNVRGGESDQNLILIDGYPIYNPFHLGGLFSTFIDPTVRDVTLMTGGFPVALRRASVGGPRRALGRRGARRCARHGGSLRAVVDRRVGRRVQSRQGHVDDRRPPHLRRQVRRSHQHADVAVPFSRRAGARHLRVHADDEACVHRLQRPRRTEREPRRVWRLVERGRDGRDVSVRLGQQRHRRVADEDAGVAHSRGAWTIDSRRQHGPRAARVSLTLLDGARPGRGIADAAQSRQRSPARREHRGAHRGARADDRL